MRNLRWTVTKSAASSLIQNPLSKPIFFKLSADQRAAMQSNEGMLGYCWFVYFSAYYLHYCPFNSMACYLHCVCICDRSQNGRHWMGDRRCHHIWPCLPLISCYLLLRLSVSLAQQKQFTCSATGPPGGYYVNHFGYFFTHQDLKFRSSTFFSFQPFASVVQFSIVLYQLQYFMWCTVCSVDFRVNLSQL